MMGKAIKGIFPNGKQTDYFGGVLPLVLVLLLIVSLIFSQRLKSYRNETRLYQQTKQFYQGKTLESLSVAKVQRRYANRGEDFSLSGEDRYNIGRVTYEIANGEIRLRVTLDSGLSYVENRKLN